MVALYFLLLGTNSIKLDWRRYILRGLLVLAAGTLIALEASDRETFLLLKIFGWLLIVFGLFQMVSTIKLGWAGASRLKRIGGGLIFIIGLAIADFPSLVNRAAPLLLGLVLLLNGAFRSASALVIRFPKWRWNAGAGIITIGLAALCFFEWPGTQKLAVPIFFGLSMTGWGATTLLTAFRLRKQNQKSTADPGSGALQYYLNHFVNPRYRKCYSGQKNPDLTASPGSENKSEALPGFSTDMHQPLSVYIWTPGGSAEGRTVRERSLIGRYIATVDRKGKVSNGHAALEASPDLYISHYPRREMIARARTRHVVKMLRSVDRKGKYLTDHKCEVDAWIPPNVTIRFSRSNTALLRRFWEMYRQDTTYNFTNRNCSVATVMGLEIALMGALGHLPPDRLLFSLLFDLDFWAAAFIRWGGTKMAWTPGLVMDYATALQRVLEKRQAG